MSKRASLIVALLSVASIGLVGCASDLREEGSTTASPESSSSSPSSSATVDAFTAAKTEAQREGAEMRENDPELDRLITAWEANAGMDCVPSSAGFEGENAVYCDGSYAIGTFASHAEQQGFRSSYVTLRGSGPGADTALDGDGWSIFVMADDAKQLQAELGGEISNLDDNPDPVAVEPTPSEQPTSLGLCPSEEGAESLIAIWGTVMDAVGTDNLDVRAEGMMAATRALRNVDKDSGGPYCPNEQMADLYFMTSTILPGSMNMDGIQDTHLEGVAYTGNEWLESIGREDLEFATP